MDEAAKASPSQFSGQHDECPLDLLDVDEVHHYVAVEHAGMAIVQCRRAGQELDLEICSHDRSDAADHVESAIRSWSEASPEESS